MAFLSRLSAMSDDDRDALKNRLEQEVDNNKFLYSFQGIAFIIFGLLAVALPSVVAMSIELVIGAILLVSGIFQFIISKRLRMHWWSLLSALLSIIIGGLMLWHPASGLLAIITLLMVFLFVEGVFEILLALQFYPLWNWSWMFVSGSIALILAGLLWMGFPELGVLYLGWVVALNLILYGVSLLMLVLSL